jgi:hypothetical protein
MLVRRKDTSPQNMGYLTTDCTGDTARNLKEYLVNSVGEDD